jgi:hypothetical protein
MRCGQAPRKRKRASSVNSDSAEDVPITALEPRERHARRKSDVRGRSKSRLRDPLSDEDILMSDATVEKPKGKGAARPKKKPEPAEVKKDETPVAAKTTAPKRRRVSHVSASRGPLDDEELAEELAKEAAELAKEAAASTTSPKADTERKTTAKRGAKKRKTKE